MITQAYSHLGHSMILNTFMYLFKVSLNDDFIDLLKKA